MAEDVSIPIHQTQATGGRGLPHGFLGTCYRRPSRALESLEEWTLEGQEVRSRGNKYKECNIYDTKYCQRGQ